MIHSAITSSSKKKKLLQQSSVLSLLSLHNTVVRLSNLKNTSAIPSTHSLINFLICQTVRSHRLIIAPVRIHLRVASRTGNVPVTIRLGATNI